MKNIFTQFNKQIDERNQEIETYRVLAPKIMPVMKLLSKEIKHIKLRLESCVLSFEYNKLPDRIYHILDENNLIGEPICQDSWGLGMSFSFKYSQIRVENKN